MNLSQSKNRASSYKLTTDGYVKENGSMLFDKVLNIKLKHRAQDLRKNKNIHF